MKAKNYHSECITIKRQHKIAVVTSLHIDIHIYVGSLWAGNHILILVYYLRQGKGNSNRPIKIFYPKAWLPYLYYLLYMYIMAEPFKK